MSRVGRVIGREMRRLGRFPMLWCLLGPIPLAAWLLLVGVFHSEVARQLPIAICDLDGSEAARTAARWVGATRTVIVVRRVEDLGTAEDLLVRRDVYAALVIPLHFERDLLQGRSPHVTLLYNEQYLTAGNLIAADVSRAVQTGSGAVSVAMQRSRGLTGEAARAAANPVRVDAHLLFNPAINYARGVGLVLVAGLLQIVVGLSSIYVVGRELRDGTAGEWLAAAGGSLTAAWIGKLAPYLLYDLVLMLAIVGGFVSWFGIPVLGHLGLLALGGTAFALATQAIGVLLTVWTGNLRKALGLGSILFGPSVAFSGGTFPRIAMPAFAQVWGGCVPLTRFLLVLRDQVLVGASLHVSAAPVCALVGTALVAGLLAAPRVGRVLKDPRLWGGA